MKANRRTFWAISLMSLCGCSYLTSQIDREVTSMAAQVQKVAIRPAFDQAPSEASQSQPAQALPPATPEKAPAASEIAPVLPSPELGPAVQAAPDKQEAQNSQLVTVAFQQPEKKPPRRLVIPPNLPGAKAPPIINYPTDPEEKKRFLQSFFPSLPKVPQLPLAAQGPEGRPMTLSDLQRLAALYSPAIKSAEAAVEAAKGAAKQAGAYPNPTMFFEQDTVGTGPFGYQGFGFHQTVKTGNKLKLQQAAAMMDLLNAQLALKRAYIDLAYQVRTNYFAVLVARESMKINQALYEFSEEVLRVQVEMIEGQVSAPYEALQLRPLAMQARFNLIQAQNQYLASWRQLVAAMGLRAMPLTELAGRIDMPVPVFEHQQALTWMLANHTDVRTDGNAIQRARFNLELAKVTVLPDVDLNVLGQKDSTAPPNVIAHSLQLAVPVPFFNQNAGGIKQATAQLVQTQAQLEQTRNTLTQSLADAFNRYATNRANVATTYQQIEDQVRAYSMLVGRRWTLPQDVSFGDQVVAQQLLGTYIANYITALGLQWLAACDVANLLQTDDLFQVGPQKEVAPVPDLKQLGPRPGWPSCVKMASPSAPGTVKAERPAPLANSTLSAALSHTPTGSPDDASTQPAASTVQPEPAAQVADTADDERSREGSNLKRW